jgi:hypothetical protein
MDIVAGDGNLVIIWAPAARIATWVPEPTAPYIHGYGMSQTLPTRVGWTHDVAVWSFPRPFGFGAIPNSPTIVNHHPSVPGKDMAVPVDFIRFQWFGLASKLDLMVYRDQLAVIIGREVTIP